MKVPSELTHNEVLGIELEVLRQKHRDLDLAISVLAEKSIDHLAAVSYTHLTLPTILRV